MPVSYIYENGLNAKVKSVSTISLYRPIIFKKDSKFMITLSQFAVVFIDSLVIQTSPSHPKSWGILTNMPKKQKTPRDQSYDNWH